MDAATTCQCALAALRRLPCCLVKSSTASRNWREGRGGRRQADLVGVAVNVGSSGLRHAEKHGKRVSTKGRSVNNAVRRVCAGASA